MEVKKKTQKNESEKKRKKAGKKREKNWSKKCAGVIGTYRLGVLVEAVNKDNCGASATDMRLAANTCNLENIFFLN